MQDTIMPAAVPAPAPSQHDALAVAAFIVVWFMPLAGAILGHVANGRARAENRAKSGLAVAAVWLGWIGTGGYVLLFILIVASAVSAANSTPAPLPSY